MKAPDFIAGTNHQEGDSSHSPVPHGDPDPGSADQVGDVDLERLRGESQRPGALTKGVKGVGASIVCLGIIAAIGLELCREHISSVDQARIERECHPISSRIDGMIRKIFVANGQYVRAGDLLVEMDKREIEAKLAAAAAEVVQDQTTMQASAMRLSKEQPALEKAVATMRHRERELDTALLDYEAILGIRSKRGISTARLSAARKEYEEALSLYSQAKAALASAIERVQSDQDLSATTAAKLRTAQATIQQAERQLSYAQVYATVNGRVVFDKSKLAQQRLRAGEVFISLLGEPCIVANFDRSQAKRLKPGQRVRIRVEGVQKHTFYGKVASIGPAARRPTVPVKITFDADSLLGFEDHMDPGLASSVELAAE